MLTYKCSFLAAFIFSLLAFDARAVQTAIPAEKMKQLQGVGRNVVMQSAEKAGVQGEQRALLLDRIARIRGYFSSQLLDEAKQGDDSSMPGISIDSTPAREGPGQHLSWTQEIASTVIELLYDGQHAQRYRARRSVFRSVEDLGALSSELSGNEWWQVWGRGYSDQLKMSQSKALERLIAELENDLDFRKSVSRDQAAKWIGRLTTTPGVASNSSPVPMIKNVFVNDTAIVGE